MKYYLKNKDGYLKINVADYGEKFPDGSPQFAFYFEIKPTIKGASVWKTFKTPSWFRYQLNRHFIMRSDKLDIVVDE